MTEPHAPARALAVLAAGLELAADQPETPVEDVQSLIATGRALVSEVTGVPAGPATIHLRHAASLFCRAWARHRPDIAADLIDAAERLECARDYAIATHQAPKEN